MAEWKNYIEVVSKGADDPVTVNYDYDLWVQNNHKKVMLKVTIKIVCTTGSDIESLILNPKESLYVCTVEGGPTFENCLDVEILAAEEISDQ